MVGLVRLATTMNGSKKGLGEVREAVNEDHGKPKKLKPQRAAMTRCFVGEV